MHDAELYKAAMPTWSLPSRTYERCRFVAFALALAMVSSGIASAQTAEQARAAFEQMPIANRRAVQFDLIWAGLYVGIADGEFGGRTYEAIRAFQQAQVHFATGIVTGNDITSGMLRANAEREAAQVRYRVVEEPRAGVRLGIPGRFVGAPDNTDVGAKWTSLDKRIEIKSFHYDDGTDTIEKAYASTLRVIPQASTVEYRIQRPEFYVISYRTSSRRHYIRALRSSTGTRGFEIAYPNSMLETFERVVIAMASSLELLPRSPTSLAPQVAQARAVSRPQTTPPEPAVAPSPSAPVSPLPASAGRGAAMIAGNDTSWIQIASRPTQAAAVEIARAYIVEFPSAAVFRASNGLFAVVLGHTPTQGVDRVLSDYKSDQRIPKDSLVAGGRRLVELMWPQNGDRAILALTYLGNGQDPIQSDGVAGLWVEPGMTCLAAGTALSGRLEINSEGLTWDGRTCRFRSVLRDSDGLMIAADCLEGINSQRGDIVLRRLGTRLAIEERILGRPSSSSMQRCDPGSPSAGPSPGSLSGGIMSSEALPARRTLSSPTSFDGR